jgi:NADPH:quinone reductase-like Zn-dependent oxidoreductase
VRDAIFAATNGRGADVIYDPVGGATAADALQALASFGRFLVVGFASGEWLQVRARQASPARGLRKENAMDTGRSSGFDLWSAFATVAEAIPHIER